MLKARHRPDRSDLSDPRFARVPARLGVGAAAAVVCVSFVVPRQSDDLIPPTGPFAVGVSERRWIDTTRLEAFTGDPYDPRTLDVRIWYPAASVRGHRAAPYFGSAEAARRVLGDDYVGRVQEIATHAAVDPPVARGGRFPVVLISHSLGSLGVHYTALGEELASQGYVVVAPTHSYGSAVTFGLRGAALPIHSRWGENQRTTQEAELFWWEMMVDWARDLSFALDQISAEHLEPTERFGGRLDLSRVVVIGHGHGGSAAVFTAQADRRFRAAVSLDGAVRSPSVRRGLDYPLLWLESDRTLLDSAGAARAFRTDADGFRAHRRRLDANRDSLLTMAPARSYAVELRGATTAHLSDLATLVGSASPPGELSPREGVRVTRDLIVAFVAMHTERGNPEEIVSVAARYPQVGIRRLGPETR